MSRTLYVKEIIVGTIKLTHRNYQLQLNLHLQQFDAECLDTQLGENCLDF